VLAGDPVAIAPQASMPHCENYVPLVLSHDQLVHHHPFPLEPPMLPKLSLTLLISNDHYIYIYIGTG